MAQLINLGGVQPVDEGEALVVQYLANVLPSLYLLYPNLEVTEPGRQPYEYDLVVVAPHAVYVVEIKRWLGQISGGDYKWLLSSGQEKVNPLRLTNHKARVLKSRLVRFSSSLKSVWVEACVVIANEHTRLHLTGAAAERTFLYPAVVHFLSDPVHLHRGERPIAPNELAAHRNSIRDAIEQEARIRTRAPHQIGHYTVVETLARTDLTDEYLVQNNLLPNSPVVRLRMYTFSPYMNSAQRDSQLHRIKRDAFALQSIGANPNLLAINDFFADDAGHFIEITPWSEQGTLRDLLERGQSLNFDQKVHILLGIAQGLAIAHAKGVIHRDLRPENILLDTNLTPRLMNFDHARLELPNQATVWRPLVLDADRRYLAPELDQPTHTVTPASDLYALGAIIYELFSGNVPFADIAARQQAGGMAPSLTSLVPDLPSDLVNLAFTLYQVDSTARHYNALEVIGMLDQLLRPTALPVVDSISQPPAEYPLHYRVGEEMDGRFKVLAVLGSGGFGQVYKVFHDITSEVYAMKVINGNYSLEQLTEEYKILKALEHPNIARVSFADRIHPTQFFLLMELIEGELLTTFTSPDNLLPPQEVIRLIGQLLQALDYIHQPNRERMAELRRKGQEEELTQEEFEELQKASSRYLHRDIKPGNLMLDRHGNLKLIDFNIAARLNSQLRYTLIGTPNYMAPDIQMLGWDESVDLFAVGVVVYEMITGHYPFPGTLQMGSESENPQTYRSDLTDEFAQFLRKAIQPAREHRFRTAQEMYIDLQAIADHLMLSPTTASTPTFQIAELEDGQRILGTEPSDLELEAWERDKPNYNPYVTRLLTLYSQARYTNSGTRGLDPIARATYISTWLDERLLPDILSGKHRLVIITGNAGDGKTAFIQQLEAEAVLKGSVVQSRPGSNGKRFHLAGLDFETNYDGSQDEGDKPNDYVLDDFLAPFAGVDPFASSDASARIIAINEGRLRDFLHAYRSSYPYLQKVVSDFLDFVDVESTLEGSLLIVNLNWRSVVVGNESSILSRQIKKLVDPKFWVSCQNCDFRDRCFIRANASRVADSSGGGQIVERLRSLFEVVYLRRRLHITMRDMRSVLSYILLRDHSCDDIAHQLSDNIAPLDYLKYFYYNAIAAPDEPAHELERSSGQAKEQPEEVDRLLRQLVQIDPALVANPGDDRAIYFATSKQLASSPLLGFDNSGYDRELLNQVHVALQNEEGHPVQRSDFEVLNNRLLYHAMVRRKSFFERRDTGWRAMLPYRYIQDFIKLTDASGQHSSEQELKSKIAFAISRSAGMRQRDYAGKNVVLRASTTAKASIKSFRLFPVEDFSLHTPKLGKLAAYVEYTPDRLLFQHTDKSVRLTISLDLFELLSQISDGMVPSPADIQGYFLNLTIFKNALAHLPYREVLLTENDLQFYRVWLDDNDILHIVETPKEHN